MTGLVWGVCAALFTAGLAMAVFRRALVAMLLGLELMISAVNVSLVYHAGLYQDLEGLSAAFLILAVAAAEAVVGLCLIMRLHDDGRAAETRSLQELKG